MARSGGLWKGDELPTEFFGAPGQLADDSFAIAVLKVVLALVGVLLAFGEHGDNRVG